jgi:hypothetical protein
MSSRRRQLTHLSGASNISLADIPADGAHFCSPGTSFGNDSDLGTCSVVQLILPNNNLVGSLPDIVFQAPPQTLREVSFSNLQVIALEGNSISGRFPSWIAQLPVLRRISAQGNTFTLNDADEQMMAAMCNRAGVVCAGLPGVSGSCRAFGDRAVLLWPKQADCALCVESSVAGAQWLGLFALFAVVVMLYTFMVHLYAQGKNGFTRIQSCTSAYPTSLKGWVACSCVFTMHAQTLVLIGGVRPYWPRTIQVWFGTFTLRMLRR